MKDSLAHLPPERQEQLRDIAKLIQHHGEGVEMVILFGSYARGNREDSEDERRFELLEAAYVGARYSMNYRITREALELLAGVTEQAK